MKNITTPLLSIIVPAYKCSTIDRDLIRLNNFLKSLKIKYEVICVIDGLSLKKDQTFKKANQLKNRNITVYFYPQNQGKGYAVRYGFGKAKGQIIGFFDAGSDIDLRSLKTAIDIFSNTKADIVIGSKQHPESKILNYPIKRRLLSFASQLLTKTIFNLSVSDTQVGLKLFKREVIDSILPSLTINGFAFDIELLSLVQSKKKWTIVESPVRVRYNKKSTVSFKSLFSFFREYLLLVTK